MSKRTVQLHFHLLMIMKIMDQLFNYTIVMMFNNNKKYLYRALSAIFKSALQWLNCKKLTTC